MVEKKLQVKCPECDKNFNYYSSEFRPFCCERCKMIDLGLWLTGSYTLESSESLSENDMDFVVREHEKKEDDEI